MRRFEGIENKKWLKQNVFKNRIKTEDMKSSVFSFIYIFYFAGPFYSGLFFRYSFLRMTLRDL